jgi:hypothetical protein
MRRSMGNKVARLLVAMVVLVPMAPVESVSAVTCTDVHIVWARGANLDPNDFDWNQFVNTDLKARIGPEVSVSDYQLGNPGFGGFTYQTASLRVPTKDIDLVSALGNPIRHVCTQLIDACLHAVVVRSEWQRRSQALNDQGNFVDGRGLPAFASTTMVQASVRTSHRLR